jgi:hypothetical protein
MTIGVTALLTFVVSGCGATDKTAKPISTSAQQPVVTKQVSAITDEDRALMKKSTSSAKMTNDQQSCLLKGLESAVTRDEYLALANSKSDSDLPEALQTKAIDIAIACTGKNTDTSSTGNDTQATSAIARAPKNTGMKA